MDPTGIVAPRTSQWAGFTTRIPKTVFHLAGMDLDSAL